MSYPKGDTPIPTLTVRADVPQRAEPPPPLLTQIVAEETRSCASGTTARAHPAQNLLDTYAPAAVLRARLRAELEEVLQKAIEEAAASLRGRLEAELPDLIERALGNPVNP